MNKEEKNNYINIEIPENLKEYLTELGILKIKSVKVIQLAFSNLYSGVVVRSVFKIDKIDKSLKDLTKKIKLEVPNFTPSDLNILENEILGIKEIFEEPDGEIRIEDQADTEVAEIIEREEEIDSGPIVSVDEWLDKIAEKYGFLKYIVSKHFPEIWQVIEFILSVKNILHIKNNTLPFAGIVLGPASSSKTLGLIMLRKLQMTFYTDSFTPKSFVSHNNSVARDKIQEIDLLPKIRNKLFITPELAPIFSNKDDELVHLLGMITRILDGQGFESDSGSFGHRGYNEDIMFTWIGAAVEIPRKVHKHLSFLGPKLYFFRMVTKKKTEKEYIHNLKYGNFNNSKVEVEEALHDYLKWFGYCPFRDKDSQLLKIEFDHSKDDDNAIGCIVRLAELLSHLRGVTQTWETRETQGSDYGYSTPIIEHPSRAQTSLRNLAAGHALRIGRTSITMEDIPIIVRTVLSTAPVERVMIFDLLLNSKGKLHTSDIIEFLGTSRPTALKTMTELKVLGLVDLEKESENDDNSPRTITLKKEFDWFLSNEFKNLRQGFIPEEFECKEKIPPSEPEKFIEESEDKFSIFWKIYQELEKESRDTNDQGILKVKHDAIVYFLTSDVCGYQEIFTKESADEMINKLVEDGSLKVEGADSYSRSICPQN